MAEDCVDQAATLAQLPERASVTKTLRIHGHCEAVEQSYPLAVYGSDAGKIQALITLNTSLGEPLHPNLPYLKAEVIWAAREEMVRTVEDVLARRTRSLFLNASAAIESAPAVADLLAIELGWDESKKQSQLGEFRATARNYLTAKSSITQ